MRRWHWLAVALGAVLLAARPLAAQTDPQLRQAVALAQDGNRDSALALVRAIQASADRKTPRFAEALYTAGILATDPDSMRRLLQQVVVEQSLSPWADDALLRLAQLDYAGGNLPGAMRDLERLRADFPRSDVFADAAFWAARTYFDAHQEKPGCEWVGMGLARVADGSPTVRDQLQTFARRCPATTLAEASAKAPAGAPRDTIVADRRTDGQADSVPSSVGGQGSSVEAVATDASQRSTVNGQRDSVSPQSGSLVAHLDTSTVDPRPSTLYRVQVIAAGTRALANETATRARAMGYDAVVVEEGAFLKVRVGGYESRDDATAAQRQLAKEFPGAFIVRDQ
jgi:cell division septation protein DedD